MKAIRSLLCSLPLALAALGCIDDLALLGITGTGGMLPGAASDLLARDWERDVELPDRTECRETADWFVASRYTSGSMLGLVERMKSAKSLVDSVMTRGSRGMSPLFFDTVVFVGGGLLMDRRFSAFSSFSDLVPTSGRLPCAGFEVWLRAVRLSERVNALSFREAAGPSVVVLPDS